MTDNIKHLTSRNLYDPISTNPVFHGFFTRNGGTSSGVYEGLNCGIGSGDRRENISRNLSIVAKKAGVDPNMLLLVYQIHGSKVVVVKEPWDKKERQHADAIVSDKKAIALGILTADCAPILFVGQKENGAPVVGAAHAGWKGALYGVIENTVDAMISLGAEKQTLRACVGPAIEQSSYEVDNNFCIPFIEENQMAEKFFTVGQKDSHANFDLSGYCSWRLARYGIRNVSLLGRDTYSDTKNFYSYRRATHKKEKDYGRQISVISIL